MKQISRILTLAAVSAMSLNMMAVDPDLTIDNIGIKLPNPVPVTLASIPNEAQVTIPETLTQDNVNYQITGVEAMAAYGKSAVTSLVLPNTVTTIGDQAFASMTALTSITLPEGLLSLGNNTFYMDQALETISLPETLTKIPESCFMVCTKLGSIKIPDACTEINSAAFMMCSLLKTVEFPAGLTTIGMSAFGSCQSLTEMTCLAVNPPTFSTQGAPTAKVLAKITLYVPDASVDAYKAANVWKSMNVQALSTKPTTAMAQIGEEASAPVYHDLQGRVIENPGQGQLVIRTQNGKSVKVIK